MNASMTEVRALREKYRAERERRVRPDGARQYQGARGSFGYYAKDPYTRPKARDAVHGRVDVLVIGAGIGGLQAAAFLRDSGVESLRIMDEAGDVGGTWYWNRYPGVRCDVESYVYMPLLEETGAMPTERYARGDEIRRHAVRIAEHYDLYRDALFQTRATSLEWEETENEWAVETDRGDRFRARYVVTSSGTLTQPKLPALPGMETFRGHTFHTSRWDYSYTGGTADGGLTGLADKRVGIIGTGATGLQVIPELAESCGELVVFQRTPSTVDVRDNRPTDWEWAASLKPGWQKERMDNFLAVLAGEPVDESLVTDGWTRTTTLQRQFLTGVASEADPIQDEIDDATTMERIRARVDEIVEDPATASALKPWYRYMCKRPGFSDTYLQAFNDPRVTLVDTADTHGVTAVDEDGVFVGDRHFDLDCLIFATGFEAGVSGVVSGTLPVIGRNGQSLLESWGRGPRTLHGFLSHGFPNLFQLGALQNANSINFSHILREQALHIAAVISRAEESGAVRVEATADAEAAWIEHVVSTGRDTSEFQAECTPGYYNGEGSHAITGVTFSPGPVAFHRILEEWRRGDMADVLVLAEDDDRTRSSTLAGVSS